MSHPPELFMTARSKALGHPAALKSHPSKNEGWGTRPHSFDQIVLDREKQGLKKQVG
jgi:hypothetical protein